MPSPCAALLNSIRTISAGVLALAAAVSVAAQQQAPEGRTAEQVYKNIQVLQGTRANQLLPEMRLFGAALGVDCEFCHLEEDRSKDDKQPKQTARQMIKMMFDINKNSFDGRQQVTCYTCHRGSNEPVGVPILPTVERKEEEGPTLPLVDEILTKYIQALGGEQAIRKVTSRVITATQDIPTGNGGRKPVQAQVEQYDKAPNMVLNTYHTATFTTSDGFDGATAWSQDIKGLVTGAIGPDQAHAQRSADFYESLDLKQEYSRLTVRGIEKVNNRDAYLVLGSPDGALPERLYFDTQTGFLLRRLTVVPTPVGDSPTEVDYGDYRDTGNGIKLPFVIRMTPASSSSVLATQSTIHVTKVQNNVPLDNGKFVKPQSKPTRSQ